MSRRGRLAFCWSVVERRIGDWRFDRLRMRRYRGDEVFCSHSGRLDVLCSNLQHFFEIDRYVGEFALQ